MSIPKTSASNSSSISSSYNRVLGSTGGDRVSGSNVSIIAGKAGPQLKSRLESALEKRDVEEALDPQLKFLREMREKGNRFSINQYQSAMKNPEEAYKKYENYLRGEGKKQLGSTPATNATNLKNYRGYLDYNTAVNRS